MCLLTVRCIALAQVKSRAFSGNLVSVQQLYLLVASLEHSWVELPDRIGWLCRVGAQGWWCAAHVMCFTDDDPPPIVSPDAAKRCDHHFLTCQTKRKNYTRNERRLKRIDPVSACWKKLCDSEGKRQERRSRLSQDVCALHERLCWQGKRIK